jgi:hypothetical protein
MLRESEGANMSVSQHIESTLLQLRHVGTFPTDYTHDDLVLYVTVLEAQAWQDRATIDELRGRIRVLEKRQPLRGRRAATHPWRDY